MGLEPEVGGQGLRQGDVKSQEGVMLLPRVRGGGPRVGGGVGVQVLRVGIMQSRGGGQRWVPVCGGLGY